ARTTDVKLRVCAELTGVTVVTKTGFTAAAGAGGSLQAVSSRLATAKLESERAGKMLFKGSFIAASLRQVKSCRCWAASRETHRPGLCRAAGRPVPAAGGSPTRPVRWPAPSAARPAE